jgi:rare lipoprotein A
VHPERLWPGACTAAERAAALQRAFLRRSLLAAAAVFVVGGCASRPPAEAPQETAAMPPVSDPARLPEPRSRYGNGPIYEVLGSRYQVLPSSRGYSERGVASWYGKKFHGKPTSSREIYDMHALTAAHRTLPLPSWVRVRNLKNGKSVVVRVNDRGPFVGNRLIDLSYAAASRLDMIEEGTTLVEVTAIDQEEPLRVDAQPEPESAPAPAGLYVQVGAFGDIENARRRYSQLREGGIVPAFVHEDTTRSPALYRVRIGPIADVVEYDTIVQQLQQLGISETHLVSD